MPWDFETENSSSEAAKWKFRRDFARGKSTTTGIRKARQGKGGGEVADYNSGSKVPLYAEAETSDERVEKWFCMGTRQSAREIEKGQDRLYPTCKHQAEGRNGVSELIILAM